jgi:mannosyltransferase OCH1-like enzyme
MEPVIPRRLFSFIHTKQTLPERMKINWDTIVKENPDFECQLFDVDEAREFVSMHFNSCVLSAFETLKPYSYKSDLFRFCYLFVNGGVYVDIKYKSINGFRFSQLLDREYLTKEPLGTQTCLIALRSESQIMKECIDEIVKVVSKKERSFTPLFTGPYLLSKIHSKLHNNNNNPLNVDLQWSMENHLQTIRQNGEIILIQYPHYREDLTQMETPQPHYSVMFWNRNEYN